MTTVNNKELYALAMDGAMARLTKTNAAISELRTLMGNDGGMGTAVLAVAKTIETMTEERKQRRGKKRKGGMTPEGRARIAEAQRKRWAQVRKEQGNAQGKKGAAKEVVAKTKKRK